MGLPVTILFVMFTIVIGSLSLLFGQILDSPLSRVVTVEANAIKNFDEQYLIEIHGVRMWIDDTVAFEYND